MTGGVPAPVMLAELARAAAWELAQHLDALPHPQFEGAVAADTGWRRTFGWRRTVMHRTLLVRYVFATPMDPVGPSMVSTDVTGYLLGLGADGQLRVGPIAETLGLDVGTELPITPVPYTDERTRNVPTSRVRLEPWLGGHDASQVAPAEAVLQELHNAATLLRAQVQVQTALLKRLLES